MGDPASLLMPDPGAGSVTVMGARLTSGQHCSVPDFFMPVCVGHVGQAWDKASFYGRGHYAGVPSWGLLSDGE